MCLFGDLRPPGRPSPHPATSSSTRRSPIPVSWRSEHANLTIGDYTCLPTSFPAVNPAPCQHAYTANRMPRHRIRPPGRIPSGSTFCCSDAPPNSSRIIRHVALINGHLHLPLALPKTVRKPLSPLRSYLFHHFLHTCIRSHFFLRKLSTFLDAPDHHLPLTFSRSSKGNYFPSSVGSPRTPSVGAKPPSQAHDSTQVRGAPSSQAVRPASSQTTPAWATPPNAGGAPTPLPDFKTLYSWANSTLLKETSSVNTAGAVLRLTNGDEAHQSFHKEHDERIMVPPCPATLPVCVDDKVSARRALRLRLHNSLQEG
ncbi:hypothetical protein ACSQ67_025461 [Phaseolus vulgaris]